MIFRDVFPTGGNCFLTQVGGIRTHVSNISRLIKALGHHHGLLDAKTQAGTGSLLQG